jgi:hypothetical protein
LKEAADVLRRTRSVMGFKSLGGDGRRNLVEMEQEESVY